QAISAAARMEAADVSSGERAGRVKSAPNGCTKGSRPGSVSAGAAISTTAACGRRSIGEIAKTIRRASPALSSRAIETFLRSPRPDVRQEIGQKADRRQVRADLIDVADAGPVGDFAEHRCADAAEAERKAEKQAGHCADIAGHQLLRIDDD